MTQAAFHNTVAGSCKHQHPWVSQSTFRKSRLCPRFVPILGSRTLRLVKSGSYNCNLSVTHGTRGLFWPQLLYVAKGAFAFWFFCLDLLSTKDYRPVLPCLASCSAGNEPKAQDVSTELYLQCMHAPHIFDATGQDIQQQVNKQTHIQTKRCPLLAHQRSGENFHVVGWWVHSVQTGFLVALMLWDLVLPMSFPSLKVFIIDWSSA